MNQVQNIQFHGQTVPVFTQNQNNTHYVAMKPIVENIGLDWDGQRKQGCGYDNRTFRRW